MTDIKNALHAAGLKATAQRLAIYDYLISAHTHPSAETIYTSLKEKYPNMSLATVYKTLASLKRSGLVRELNIVEDSLRYDAATKPHAHLVCICCHTVTDYFTPLMPEDTAENIRLRTGFASENEQVYFFGLCKKCADTKKSSC